MGSGGAMPTGKGGGLVLSVGQVAELFAVVVSVTNHIIFIISIVASVADLLQEAADPSSVRLDHHASGAQLGMGACRERASSRFCQGC